MKIIIHHITSLSIILMLFSCSSKNDSLDTSIVEIQKESDQDEQIADNQEGLFFDEIEESTPSNKRYIDTEIKIGLYFYR